MMKYRTFHASYAIDVSLLNGETYVGHSVRSHLTEMMHW